MNQMYKDAQAMQDDLTRILHQLHRHPELSFEEAQTTALLRKEMQALGLQEIDLGMPTGVVALLKGGRPGPLVGIRADIDAIAENDQGDGPCRSEVPGVMHACGHDLHTVCALGAARLLKQRQAELPGDVLLVFQPAEEVTQGAAEMMCQGFMEKIPQKPLGLFSLHSASFEAGKVGARCATMAASKTHFRITVKGKGGQGGFPHECVDVIVAGAALVQAIQTIVSRNADPRKALVCAVYNLHAGDHEFFVTDTLVLSGSVRALDEDTAQMALRRVEELAAGLPAAYGCTASLEIIPHVPPLHNAPSLYPAAVRAAELVVGAENVLEPPPMLGSDDCAIFGEHMPIFYYQLGAMQPGGEAFPLHSPNFWVDPAAAPIGSALLAQAALLALQEAVES